jgi:hypothetical protein
MACYYATVDGVFIHIWTRPNDLRRQGERCHAADEGENITEMSDRKLAIFCKVFRRYLHTQGLELHPDGWIGPPSGSPSSSSAGADYDAAYWLPRFCIGTACILITPPPPQ